MILAAVQAAPVGFAALDERLRLRHANAALAGVLDIDRLAPHATEALTRLVSLPLSELSEVPRDDGRRALLYPLPGGALAAEGVGVVVEGGVDELLRARRAELGADVESRVLAQETIDALTGELALLDEQGRIIMVNRAWREFGAENDPAGRDFVGHSYLAACAAGAGDDGAEAFARGLRDLIAGRRDRFEVEYPCHSPTEQRWFLARAARFTSDGAARVVVTHEDITVRRRAEERHRHIARTLQAGLLPPRLPEPRGLELAALYRAQGEGLDVGGDFYDVFRDGEDWVLVVGDVCGKGPEAAALTAEARWTIRALATTARPPDELLRAVNRALIGRREGFAFVTAVIARVRPGPDGARVVCGRAGHPRPFVVRADGDVEPVTAQGGLLGVLESVRFRPSRVHLRPGDALVIVTDGVTEARNGARELGPDGLADALAGLAGAGAREIAWRVEDVAGAFSDGPLRDDLAVVVARARPGDGARAA
jgi:PAS domain-containing protein